MGMDGPLSSDSAPANVVEPFTLVALARQDLTAGEMVHFDVDSAGNITSTNFIFVPTTPRLTKLSAGAALTGTSTSFTNQTESKPSTSSHDQGPAGSSSTGAAPVN
jgi:hypothetical protein